MKARWLELLIGLRYTKAKKSNGFISLISIISIVCIALGVTALITVLSVMNGFEKELRSRILGMASHASITSLHGSIQNWHEIPAKAKQHPEVIGAAPYIEGQGLINTEYGSSGVLVRGINQVQESEVSDIAQKIKEGSLSSLQGGEFNAAIGSELAVYFGVDIGDKLTLIIPQTNITVLGARPRMKRFTISGIFEVGMHEYDRNMMLINIEDAAVLYQMDNRVSGVRLKLDDMFQAKRVALEVAAKIDDNLLTKDWTAQHANFFRAVKIEKNVMFIILSLIIAVAAVNIISTMVMVVTDKESEIAILRTLGATSINIRNIFLVQGAIIGFFGTLIGVICGVLLAGNLETIMTTVEKVFSVQILAPDVYYISELPSDLRWSDVYKITLVSFVLTVIATWFPARRAAKVNPAEALRYE